MDDALLQEVRKLREWMIEVHYFEESHWLAAAVAFPKLCESAVAQQALRRAVTIAWETGSPRVASWLNTNIVSPDIAAEAERTEGRQQGKLKVIAAS